MDNWEIKDISVSVINSMTETELASWLARQGIKIISHQERYWKEIYPGFYEPIHLMARLTAKEAKKPMPFCWGYRAVLHKDDESNANGLVPVHLLSDVAGYNLQKLPQKYRTHVRKCRKQVKIVQLTGPTLLQEQGYKVLCSSLQRTKHKQPPSKQNYLAGLLDYTTNKHQLVLAGLIDGKLGGYIDGYAVDGTAYIVNGYYATDALPTSIVTGLTFEFVQICRRSGNIYEIVDGLHLREKPALDSPKRKMGFPVKYISSVFWVNPIIGAFMRWRYPHKYYRLTGQD